MTPEEVTALLAYVSATDPRIRRNDPAERRLQTAAWHTHLADIDPVDAKRAVDAHYAGTSAQAALPGDIAGRARAARAAARKERLERLGAAFEAATLPEIDPDDVAGYLRELRAIRRKVADGEKAVTCDGELPERTIRLDGMFRQLPSGSEGVSA